MISILEFLAGIAIAVIILYDVFESVVVPRGSERALRISPVVVDGLWPSWRRLAQRAPDMGKREDYLGTFAPFSLMVVLVVWVVSLVIGIGLAIHALRWQIEPVPNLPSSFYLAGTSVLTIGYGDIVGHGLLARLVLLAAGASGLAVVALVISLTFTLYASFQRREVLVLTLDARAGAPPSGVMLLETYAQHGMIDDLPTLFNDWEVWAAEMLDSHLAYPILPYFRSSHSNESWVSALGAVLDASTLLLTVVDCTAPGMQRVQGGAHLFYSLGCHAVLDLSFMFGFRRKGQPTTSEATAPSDAGVERIEYQQARDRLAAAGFPLVEGERSWQEFTRHRAQYAPSINAIARHLSTPPAQWIGDRSPVAHLHMRHM